MLAGRLRPGRVTSSGRPLREEGLKRQDHPANNPQSLGIAANTYQGFNGGRLPPGGTFTENGEMLHSWETQLLLWIPYSTSGIDWQKPWNDPVHADKFKCVVPEFINPGFRTPPLTDAEVAALRRSHGEHNTIV